MKLKFRAWVYYGEKLDKPHYSKDYGSLDIFFEEHSENETGQCIEQYTGLKDRNGQEIYEGDIVMLLNYHVELNGIMECLKTDIQWDTENACFILGLTKFGSKLLLQNTEGYVVIGNIHENPKLLGYKAFRL